MTLALTIAVISIAITIVGLVVLASLRRLAQWISKHERMAVDPYASEFGDVVNAPRRSL